VLDTLANEALLTNMALDANEYTRTFILVDLAALAEAVEEEVDSENDDTTDDGDDETSTIVDEGEGEGEGDGKELPEYTFDWDMTRCTNDWNTLCASDWAASDYPEIAQDSCE